MSVAGIDFSSRAVHLVLLDDDTNQAETYTYLLRGDTPFERARSLRSTFPTRSWWDDRGVWLIGIEDPFSRSKGVAKALGLSAGAIAALLPYPLTIVQTAPHEWKRVFTGYASASKGLVEDQARKLWNNPPDTADDNTFDAYGIAWAVRSINNLAVERATA